MSLAERNIRLMKSRKHTGRKAPHVEGRILKLLRDMRGLPLSGREIHEEIGASHDTVTRVLGDLVREGKIDVKPCPDFSSQMLFYDHHEWWKTDDPTCFKRETDEDLQEVR